jgi:LuxR family transcriptional regulator, maltose regulon positive regulatory protein
VTVAAVPFGLSEVKLAAPIARPGTVAKTEVISDLCTPRSPLVSVIAPAGYGKTTLLATWAEADPRPFAWVTLDAGDDDPVVFLRSVAGALHDVRPVSAEVFEALSGPWRTTWWTCVPHLGRALARLGRPLVLVLDDLHEVTSLSCLDALATLAAYVPPGSQLVIAGREEPALPLARWRAHGLVREVGVPDLRLDEREAELLLQAAGVEVHASELSELTKRTEGWPAGLALAALSLQAGASRPADADRLASEYFQLELLSRLPEAEAHFLKHTSVLRRMCGGLCDAVLQTSGSAETLETLERRNCFVVPLDRRAEWYRYHHLFDQLLRDELERSEPEWVAELNARAMAWCIANDLPEEAVVYGHAAGETETVAGLVDALALPLYYDGRIETLEEWLGWFSDDELVRYPALAVVGAWLRVLTGRSAAADRWLALADGATSTIPLSDGSDTIEPWVATLRASMMRDGAERALADADLALERLAHESAWRTSALVRRGTMLALLGATDRATDALTAARKTGRTAGAVEEVYLAEAQLALIAAREGAWGDAGRHAREAQDLVDAESLGDSPSSALAHVVTARVALHEARLDDARAALARAHRLRPLLDHGIPWLTIQVGLELTRAHLTLAEPGAARAVLTETEHVVELRPHIGYLADEARELHDQVAATSGSAGAWAMSMTGAELRLLPYLATHLTFPEIAGRLSISRNTAKSEAVAIYRKLGVSSRSAAIERAVEVGLLDSSIYPPPANLTPEG